MKGIILFLVPLFVLLFILKKVFDIVHHIMLPIKKHLPAEHIFGIGTLTIISLFVILLVCYMAGTLVQKKRVKSFITSLEDNVLAFIPGYSFIKAQGNDMIGDADSHWKTVLIEENGEMKMGIAVDKHEDGYCMVFFPEPPDGKQGEMKLMHESKLKNMNMPISNLMKIMRKYGEGAAKARSEIIN
jgi:uncharacterized membrane protein